VLGVAISAGCGAPLQLWSLSPVFVTESGIRKHCNAVPCTITLSSTSQQKMTRNLRALATQPNTQLHFESTQVLRTISETKKNHIPNADIAYDQCLLGILDDFNHPRYPFLVKSSIRASSPKSSACNPGTQGWKRHRSYISRDQQSLTQPSRSYLLVSLTSLK
jgi:hypothetical protein